jgi:hypothetical protein
MAEAVAITGQGAAQDGLAIDVPLLAGVTLRETWSGWAPGYTPLGDYNGKGDGGHGRGLWQIDDRGPFRHLIPQPGTDWLPFDQALAAITVLIAAREELAHHRGRITPALFELACVCRYNAALANVDRALCIGVDPNLVTTGKNYGRDVLARRARLLADHPAAFPSEAA